MEDQWATSVSKTLGDFGKDRVPAWIFAVTELDRGNGELVVERKVQVWRAGLSNVNT